MSNPVVEQIVLRTAPETLQRIYSVPQTANTLEFLTVCALTHGRLLKGGTPDLTATARVIIQDWNHQKIPYFSVPPAIHPSLIPSTVNASALGGNVHDEAVVAPGAEQVGQAQILSTLSKPFALDGLFNAADAGAFGNGGGNDEVMMDDEDAFIPDEPMDMEESPGSKKRPRSDSFSSVAPSEVQSTDIPVDLPPQVVLTKGDRPHNPKRARRNKDSQDVAAALNHVNPLSRKVLKGEAKKARRMANRAAKAMEGEGMEVDGGLEFTFMS